jgi:hypothetical protein
MGLAQIARAMTALMSIGRPGQEARQLLQGALIDIALEFNHDIERTQ